MTSRIRSTFLFVAVASVIFPAVAGAQTYDFASEFTNTNGNPYGVWGYGYSAPNQPPTDFTPFTQTSSVTITNASGTHSFEGWVDGSGNTYTYKNLSPTTYYNNGVAYRPGEVVFRGGDNREYVTARFTVPQAGNYEFSATFTGNAYVGGGTNTNVQVLQNATSLFSSRVLGYGGDPSVSTSFGSSPVVSFSDTRALVAGDTLSFAVGDWLTSGGYPETGVAVTIRQVAVPAPGALITALLGALPGATLLLRRRRK